MRLTSYAIGALAGVGFERARNNEKELVRRETSKAMYEKKANGVTWKDINDYNRDKIEIRKQVIEDETVILKYEKKAQEGFEAAKDFFTVIGN